MKLQFQTISAQLRGFLAEDLGTGDLTAPLTVGHRVSGSFLVKADGVISGIDIPQYCYRLLSDDYNSGLGTADNRHDTVNSNDFRNASDTAAADSVNNSTCSMMTDDATDNRIHYRPLAHDGDQVTAGSVVAQVSGDAATILAAERVALNLMQRMSGIATATSQAVAALDDPNITILDTRKTAPGLRLFDKYAVRCGGGSNHRMGLYDLAMLKDNHLAIAGSNLKDAVSLLRRTNGPTKLIEVEVENENELRAAIDAEADIIMFDNQSVETARRWRAMVPSRIRTEVSGGMTLEKLPAYHGSGVDFISLGYLTNSVRNIDISFNLDA